MTFDAGPGRKTISETSSPEKDNLPLSSRQTCLGGEGDKIEGNPQRGMSSETPRSRLPDTLLNHARYLRKNQTNAEEYLWKLLRSSQLGVKFRRQHPINEGFVLDFYVHSKKLAIELDGGYHEEKMQKMSDKERKQVLNDMGIRVLRFKNEEVFEDLEGVLERIMKGLGGEGRGV